MISLKEKKAKTIGLLTHEKIVSEIKESANRAQACFFISFNRLPAFPFNVLRNGLRSAGSRILITKNSLFHRALAESGWQDPDSFLVSETGIVFVFDEDIVKTCKVLTEFAQENEFLQLKGGVIKDKKVTAKEITTLAKLPSKDMLRAMAVSAIASPLTGFITTLNQIILKFLWTVEEIKKVKDKK